MKIAMVFDGLQIGGAERVGSDYAKLLVSLGHDVTIFNLVPILTDMESEFPPQCKFVHVNFPSSLCPERYNKIVRWKSWGKWIFPPVSFILEIFDKFYKICLKTRKSFRESFDIAIAFSGHYDDMTFVSENFIDSRHKVCWLHGALYSYILISEGFLQLHRKIKNLVVLTRDCEVETFAYNSFLELNITQLYNPVEFYNKTVSVQIVEALKSKYDDYILMVSRMSMPHKRPDTVIDAFEICWLKYGLRKNLVFVGDGADLEKLKKYAASKNQEVSKHIYFEGAKMDVENYYKSAKILVQSSSFEGLPTTIIEALQMGLPVVATDCQTGPREILDDNKYGLLCKVGDPEDMAKKIHQLYSNQELYNYYREEGKRRGRDFYPKIIREKLAKLLNELVEEDK